MCVCIRMGMCTDINQDYLDRQKFDPAQKPGGFWSMNTIHVSVGNQFYGGAIL